MKLSDLKLKKLEELIEDMSEMDDPLFGDLLGKEGMKDGKSEEESSEEGSEEEELLKKKKPMSIKVISVESAKKPKVV